MEQALGSAKHLEEPLDTWGKLEGRGSPRHLHVPQAWPRLGSRGLCHRLN